ncbi:MAG: cytochrome c [Bacteroidota bacterium]|jgi:mono/diheme cytochrome c family protein
MDKTTLLSGTGIRAGVMVLLLAVWVAACKPDRPASQSTTPAGRDASSAVAENADPSKGIGQVQHVTLNTPLEQDRIKRGQAIYEMKCQACHRLDETRVVGPGWAGVTKRRKPEWIMNMITNVDVMLDQDPEAQKLLELCLTRMPNQNVSIGDARDILEFMRKNDGEE